MHCVSCEMLVTNDLRQIDEIRTHKVCHKRGFVELSFNDDGELEKVREIVEKHGYSFLGDGADKVPPAKLNPQDKVKNSVSDYIEIAFIFMFFIAIAKSLESINIYQYFPEIGSNLSVAVAFLLGLIASISTCLALVGGIVISFGSTYKTEEKTLLANIKPHLLFHLGRIISFMLLGGLLGSAGSVLGFSLSFTSYLTLAVAFIMIYIGMQTLNMLPNITKLGFHLPKKFSSKIHSLQEAEHQAAPFIIGALTFFLPCGFTQSAQLAAISSGSFASGALIMTAFALGTLPVLLGLGIGSSYTKNMNASFFKKVMGVLIILFGLYSAVSGLRIMGADVSFLSSSSSDSNLTEAQETIITEDGFQEIHMTVDWGFYPSSFTIQEDLPVRWVIEGENISGCINTIIIPDLKKEFTLQKGENIFEFTPTESGDLIFSCWMGMVGGKFNVVEQTPLTQTQ